jgi:hypothetical protein
MKIIRCQVKCESWAELAGSKPLSIEDLEEIKLLKVQSSHEDVYVDLNPNPAEGQRLLQQFGQAKLKEIIDEYGFVSPAVMIIENYVNFYMIRYGDDHSRRQVSEGLRAEKAFDLMLQDISVYKDYAEPIRDWRGDKPCDFIVPLLGKLEVKSVTVYKGENRFNVNIDNWIDESPDYAVVLLHLGGKWIKLVGAMPAKKVESYTGTKYHKQTDRPFWSIPCEHLTIQPKTLYKALTEVKHRIDNMEHLTL